MKRLLIFAIILAAAPAWATAILSTQTESTQDIYTAEHLLFTYTASGEKVIMFQPSLSALTATAANIQFRVVHSLGNDTVLGVVDIVANAKYAATDTVYACRALGQVVLKDGEKALFYAKSTNTSDTSVTYVVDVIDCLALPTGGATESNVTAMSSQGEAAAASSQSEAAAAANDLQTFLGTPAQAGEAAAASSQGEAAAASSQGEAAAAQAAIIEHVDAIEVDLLHTENFNLVGAAFLEAIEAADYATGTDISELLSSIPDVVLTDILIYPENKLLTDENGFVVSLHGDGTSKCTIPIQTAGGIGISGACIRIATDNIGANIIDVQYTDSFGYASFYLQVGKTYYYRVTSSSYQSAGWTSFVAVAD
jgi:hypothetical protein